ncbi:hypothetical protein CHGG_09908 [Chaetomium globosum CBS 148.51]|uniref:Uncharacterized protein n=1 Tax=Chaetomium globosum (strain ATCC 6205 / CBS 148.51 / DSM 1962 / NBRC 6347 / NRRL 1970) TaxID=306901 RepID=Q2GQ46_CHAGB|nr:uncharacterized protein CHGG_09908 [Chaetomium globosum CBS 148.51]EAQ83504.1 hypothetical protein CHGG_09908 [Chaetomium globosum CBS 148.51]
MSRPYVVGDSSPFLKRVLIPFWIVRILIMLVQIGLYALVITGLSVFKDDMERLYAEYHTTLQYDAVLAVSCVIMAIILLCLILDIVCIIMRARRRLTPQFFLTVNIIQSVFYVVNFALTMAGPRNGVLSVVIGVLILLSFLGLLIYASVVYHQYRKGSLRGTYVQANNPEVHNLVADTGYPAVSNIPPPPQHMYGQDEGITTDKAAYYDRQAIAETNAYSGHSYPSTPAAHETQHPQQQGYEMHQRSAV